MASTYGWVTVRRDVRLITVPYDSGRRFWRMGAGPPALVAWGLVDLLHAAGHSVSIEAVVVDAGDEREELGDVLGTTLAIAAATATHVREARVAGAFPLVLAGNCFTTVGAVIGLDELDVAVVWLDAHGDLNTPETSTSGFLDGMAAATLLGWCHAGSMASIPGYRALPEPRFLLVGARDFDPGEARRIAQHALQLLPPLSVTDERRLERVLADLLAPADGVWLHVDLDVLDPEEIAPANSFAPRHGLTLYQTVRIVQEVVARGRLEGMTISAYDPAVDPSSLVPAAVVPLVWEALQTS